MELTEHTLEELSALKHCIYTMVLPPPSNLDVLVVAFEGTYGHGCKGNGDARYITAIISAAQSAWESDCFVLDYRAMSYEWGDKLPLETGHQQLRAEDQRVLRNFNAMPQHYATLISKRNKKGISSLTTAYQKASLYTSLEDACISFEAAWKRFQFGTDEAE